MSNAFFSSERKRHLNNETAKSSLILSIGIACTRRSRKQSAILLAGSVIAFCIQRWWRFASRRRKNKNSQRTVEEHPHMEESMNLFGWKPSRRVSCRTVCDHFNADVAAILDGDPLWDENVYPNAREMSHVDQVQVAAILDGDPLMDNNVDELCKSKDSRDVIQLRPQ